MGGLTRFLITSVGEMIKLPSVYCSGALVFVRESHQLVMQSR